MAIDKDRLPFVLSIKVSEQLPKNRLPFALNRKLGTLDISPIIAPPPIDSAPKPPPNPFGRLVMGGLAVKTQTVKSIGTHYTDTKSTKSVAKSQIVKPKNTLGIQKDIVIYNKKFTSIENHQSIKNVTAKPLWQDTRLSVRKVYYLGNLGDFVFDLAYHLTNTADILNEQVIAYHHCQSVNVRATDSLWACIGYRLLSKPLTTNFDVVVKKAVPVPCRYYPIPEISTESHNKACQIRPTADRLPFKIYKKRRATSDRLAFKFICWHDDEPAFVPSLRSYIVQNTITASLDGVDISPLGFEINCDMDGYCWQGSVSITHNQYIKIKDKLNKERGDEPLLVVNVNGKSYAVIAEIISRSRKFNDYSYQIGGRSIVARLGEDYAKRQGGTINQDLYASQIVGQMLANTGVSLDVFGVDDWLIDANTISIENQTPIAVIGQIATACGGFIYADPFLPKLSILPKYKVPAWELANSKADLELPLSVIRSIDDKKRVNPRYNTVTLIGKQASEIYRQHQGRELIAPIDNNPLFTAKQCVINKGIQILSDSGTHMDYTLNMRVANDYNLPLAQLGQIWQISDNEGVFNGLIVGVSLSVNIDNGAISVWQTVDIDRYVDI